ncbi:MAG: SLATT domain-containing protein [Gammaproteobacteria bacterium]|nr:SLATT domain-containing protein [Gammaproteobacteria bacterium]
MITDPHKQDGWPAEQRDLLGAPTPDDDWRLEPSQHAARLDPKAVALKQVLEHSTVQSIMRRYDRYDHDADVQQASYKKYGIWEIYLTAIAAILGGIILVMNDAQNVSPAYENLRIALLVVQLVCAAGVVGMKYLLQAGKPFQAWQKSRSLAETARIELFETVCGLGRDWEGDHQDSDYPLLPLQLEYFIRYQLMVQVVYYDKRGRQHQKAAKRYTSFGAIITFIVTLAAGLGGFALELIDTVSVASIAAMVAPVLLGMQTSLSRLNQDERNAARYEITHAHLEKLRGKTSDIRLAAGNGDAATVHAFIRDVDLVISVEHSQWINQLAEKEIAEVQK